MRSGFECRTETVWVSWWLCLSNVLRLSLRWLKRAPRRAGQVSATGLAVDHSKDDTMSSSEIGSEPVSNLRIIVDAAVTQSPSFIWALWWSIHRCVASLQFSALLFFHFLSPDTWLQPLWVSVENQSMHSHWEERNLVLDNLRCLVWIINLSEGS